MSYTFMPEADALSSQTQHQFQFVHANQIHGLCHVHYLVKTHGQSPHAVHVEHVSSNKVKFDMIWTSLIIEGMPGHGETGVGPPAVSQQGS